MSIGRISAVAGKESREIVRDPITLGTAVLLPIALLFLFGYAVSLDVDNVSLGVLDHDKSPASRRLLDRFATSGHFVLEDDFTSQHGLESALKEGRVRLAVVVPPGFQRKLLRKEVPGVQILVDATHSATSLIVANYARAVVSADGGAPGGIRLRTRVWYNPSLLSIQYFIPGLYGVLLMSIPPLLTALGIVREKESGTVQQIFASPVRPSEFILGKLIPYAAIAFFQMVTVMLIGSFWFGVAVRGSVLFLLATALLYVMCTVGIGLLVSTLTRSQLAAMLAALMITLMPSYLFSGFLFPIFTMPFMVRLLTQVFPTRYFVEISRGVVMKGAGIEELWGNVAIIALYTAAVFFLASMRLKKKVA